MEQIQNFNYLDYNMGSNNYNYRNIKVSRFQNLCGSIRRTLLGKVQKKALRTNYENRGD